MIIGQMWSDLLAESRQVDRSLKDVKKSFAVVGHEILFLHIKEDQKGTFTYHALSLTYF